MAYLIISHHDCLNRTGVIHNIGKLRLIIIALTLYIPLCQASDPLAAIDMEVPQSRKTAPDFSLSTLQGDRTSLADYRGKVVFLNFWATWCEPCRKEMPSMQTLWQQFKDRDFVILAIAADEGNKKGIAEFVEKYRLTYPVLLDPAGIARNDYDIVGLPITYLIGKDGKISGRLLSSRDWSNAESVAAIEYLLKINYNVLSTSASASNQSRSLHLH